MTNPERSPDEIIIEFVMKQSIELPTSERLVLYKAAKEVVVSKGPLKKISGIIKAMEDNDRACLEFSFMNDKR